MIDNSDERAAVDEIIAAVRAIRDERDRLRAERDELLQRLDEHPTDEVRVFEVPSLPHGRRWAFHEDARVLALGPGLAPVEEIDLTHQLRNRPRLVTCMGCGAPVWASTVCDMCETITAT